MERLRHDFSRPRAALPKRIASALRAVERARADVQSHLDWTRVRLLGIVDLRDVPGDALEDFDCVVREESAVLREAGLGISPVADVSGLDVRVVDLKRLASFLGRLPEGSCMPFDPRAALVLRAVGNCGEYLRGAYSPETRRAYGDAGAMREVAEMAAAVSSLRWAGVDGRTLAAIAEHVGHWAAGKAASYDRATGRRWTYAELLAEKDPDVFRVAAELSEARWVADIERCEMAGASAPIVRMMRKELYRLRALRRRRAPADVREAG